MLLKRFGVFLQHLELDAKIKDPNQLELSKLVYKMCARG